MIIPQDFLEHAIDHPKFGALVPIDTAARIANRKIEIERVETGKCNHRPRFCYKPEHVFENECLLCGERLKSEWVSVK